MPWGNRAAPPPPNKRFWNKVEKSKGCWLYLGAVNKWGYGKFWANKKDIYAHKFSFELHFGPPPKGKKVLHHCDNPRCVRPDHLYPGTDKDNARDCIARGRFRPGGHIMHKDRKEKITAGNVKEEK